MGNEVLKLIRTMDMNDLDTQFALQCAPLVAGLKISNLLILPSVKLTELYRMLNGTHLSFYALCVTGERASVLVYDERRVNAYLKTRRVRETMNRFGYGNLSLSAVLPQVRKKYRLYAYESMPFPHELGLLLGYPAEDVIGFFSNNGENCLYTGYWKVYADVPTKLHIFESFEKAQERLVRLVSEGRDLKDIIEKGA